MAGKVKVQNVVLKFKRWYGAQVKANNQPERVVLVDLMAEIEQNQYCEHLGY